MNLLAIELSSQTASVALYQAGEIRFLEKPGLIRQGELILPMIDQLLAVAGLSLSQLDALAFGRGPGSFTGIRMAASVTQGLAFAAGLPVVPISSLEALAARVLREYGEKQIAVAVDARMQQVYWATYGFSSETHRLEPVERERVIPVAQLPWPVPAGFCAVGNAWQSTATDLRYAALAPLAYDIAQLAATAMAEGKSLSAAQALPQYFSDPIQPTGGFHG